MKRYEVRSLDMWGHVPADCCTGYDCPCVSVEDGVETHDDNACDCQETCNAEYRAGTVEVTDDEDATLIAALITDGFLEEEARALARVDDYTDGTMLDIVDDAGRRVFHLILVSFPVR